MHRFGAGRLLWCALGLMALAAWSSCAQEPRDDAPRSLLIVDDQAYAPFAFLDAEGQPRGFTIDLWRLWSQRTGVPVEFQLMEWEDALSAVREGRADVVGGLFQTPEREEWLDFTQPLFEFPTSVFFHEHVQGIKTLGDLTGFTVGVIRSDSSEELIRTQYPAINLRRYATMEEMVRAAIAGEIKVFVADTPVALHYLAKLPGSEGFRESATPLLENQQYAAVRKGRTEVLELVRSGFDRISDEEIAQILDAWGGMPVARRVPWKKIGLGFGAMFVVLWAFVIWNVELRRRVRRATRDLRESETRYRALLEGLPDIVARFDAEARYVFVSDKIREATGMPASAFIGKNNREVGFPERLSTVWEEALREVFRSGAPFEMESTVEGPRGKVILNSRLLPERDTQGRVCSVLTISRDITAHRRTEQQYTTLFREMLEGFALHEIICNGQGRPIDYRFLAINPAFERTTGLKADSVVGRRVLEILPETEPYWIETYGRVALTGEPVSFERENKEIGKHFEVSAFSPAPRQFACVFSDITGYKRAEEALRQKTEELERYFSSSLDLLCIASTEGRFIRLNPEWERVLGYSVAELEGRAFLELVHPDDRADTLAAIGKLEAQEEVLSFENRYRCKDGSYRWIEWRSKPVGKTIYAAARDVTERKRAEEAIRASEERFDLAMGVANDGLWDWNIAQDTVYFDSRYYTIAGYEPNEFPRRFDEWARRVHPDDIDRCRAAIHAHLSGETAVFDIEFRFRRKDDTWMWIRGRGKVVERDERGAAARMLGTHTDITDLKKAEEEQEKLRTQLAQAQKMESVGRLAGGVAHDFNNMLGVILGQTELAMDALEPREPLFANLLEIRRAAERSAELTRQLLAFARKQTVAPKVLDLNETVDGMLMMLRRLIGEDIDLVWLPNENAGRVKVDPAQVNQILVNLCVNARDAIGDTGKITIETGAAVLDEHYSANHEGLAPGDYAMLAVSDDGCGMDKATLDKLFEPFFTTKEKGRGTGLGLATVYGIVKQNNGSVTVYSEPEHGTTFKVYLPKYTGREGMTPTSDVAKPTARGFETILLVEDEPGILKMATAMLKRQGYTVLTAALPGEAIRLAEAYPGPIHLLMTDVVMPEMNGRDLAKNLLTLYPDIKRLYMSGYTANVIAHRGVLDEGVHFIQKPFSMSELATKVRETLESE